MSNNDVCNVIELGCTAVDLTEDSESCADQVRHYHQIFRIVGCINISIRE
jgi:hypothetical protein